jgi:Dyp-type peroxidase family
MSLMDQRSARLRAPTTDEPLLEVEDIQGNILAGFNKDHQTLVALLIEDVGNAKRWLRRVHSIVASTAEVLAFNDLFRRLRSRRGMDPQGLAATWVNVAFSAAGLRKLMPAEEVDAIPDEAFQLGMLARAEAILHDPATPGAPGAPDTWRVGGPGNEADILLIVASDLPEEMANTVRWLLSPVDAADVVPRVLYQEEGHSRVDLPGHEHFGFKDGVSQPAVRGRIAENPDVLLEPRLIAPNEPDAERLSRPGQPLLWPGLFVFGYPVQTREDGSSFDPGPVSPEWLRNGSMLVFRRLLQDVAAFRRFVRQTAEEIALRPGFSWMTASILEAMFVGRWPSGAPLARSPLVDPGAGGLSDNHFLWETPAHPLRLRPEAGQPAPIPGAPADIGGRICPHAAHVRKVNPRDQDTELGTSFDTLTRRILRRGIPFGAPLPDPAPAGDHGERGLLFLCYQRSIVDQFEVISQNWANNPETPKPGGHDPIIGQSTDATRRERTFEIKDRASPLSHATLIAQEWVITSGGGYFFAPSLTTLREKIAGPEP